MTDKNQVSGDEGPAHLQPEIPANARNADEIDSDQPNQTPDDSFPIVGVGASAGGLQAFEQFFSLLPADSGMAFVLVQHLDPTHDSILASLIERFTQMPVLQIEDDMPVAPNHVYVIPPNVDLTLQAGQLRLAEPARPRGRRLPIDRFFRSLAEEQEDKAIGVVLSGTGSDGALGIKAIAGKGGLILAQDPTTTDYYGMPQSAIATGLVDFVLPPDQMAEQLINYVRHAYTPAKRRIKSPVTADVVTMQKIFKLLHDHTGHDFSGYKPGTIGRRLQRRMAINQLLELRDYLQLLRQNPVEIDLLFREFLISVTSFFRDPDAFELLAEQVIAGLVERAGDNDTIRVWVPGCATGEEAYALAILFCEQMDALDKAIKVQIFATDIDPAAIDVARSGIYPENISADVGAERLQRFFIGENKGFRVDKRIRDMVVVAEQSLIKDAPFSRLNLISCRNVLIYLDTALQKGVIPLFHYALNPGGYLFLGQSETLGNFARHFKTIDQQQRLFQRPESSASLRSNIDFPLSGLTRKEMDSISTGRPVGMLTSIREAMQRLLLDEYTPACVLVNEHGEIFYIHRRVGQYLELTTGVPTMNVLRLAREGLRTPLSIALRKAATRGQGVINEAVKFVTEDDDRRTIRFSIQPLVQPPAVKGLYLIVFSEAAPSNPLLPPQRFEDEAEAADLDPREQRIQDLEQELRATKEYLRTIIEELETTNEELKSSNEELQSANEELQSTNEELETSTEELQSANEELITLNQELEHKIEALTQANNDVSNLLHSVPVGIIFLDHRLQTQRFNAVATRLVNLIDSDLGRPIEHIVSNIIDIDLPGRCRQVLETSTVYQAEVLTTDDHWYAMRIQPYRTLQGATEGVILTFADITRQKQAQNELEIHRQNLEKLVDERTAELRDSMQELQASEERYHSLFENAQDAIMIANDQARYIDVNPACRELLGYTREELLELNVWDITPTANQEQVEALWQDFIDSGQQSGLYRLSTKAGELVEAEYRAVANFMPGLHLSVFRDVTERNRAEAEAKKIHQRLVDTLESISDGFFALDDRLVVTYFNKAAEQLLGRDRQEVMGQPLFEAFPEAKGSIFEEKYTWAVKEKQFVIFETYFAPYDDWYEVRVYPFENGISVYFQVTTERKEAEEKLRRREQEFRALVENSPDMVARFDRQLRHLYVNPAICRVAGLSFEEYIGQTNRDLNMPAELTKQWDEALRNVFETGQQTDMEFEYATADGPRHFQARLAPEFGRDGAVETVVSKVRDITALRESERKFRLLFEMANDIVFLHPLIVDETQLQFLEVNSAACEILGYSKEELLQKSPLDIVIDDDLTTVPEERKSLQDEHSLLFEKTLLTKSGEKIPVEIHARLFELQAQPTVLSIARDITERKQMEKALRESEQRFRTITELVSDFTYSLRVEPDQSLTMLWSTDALLSFTDQSVGERVPAISDIEMIYPDDIPILEQRMEVLLSNEEDISEYRVSSQDGEVRWLRDYGRPVWDAAEGRVVGILGAAQDITERRQAEEQLRTALAEKETLLRELYHRTKNNMQVISSMLGLQTNYIDDAQTLQLFKEMQNRIRSMALVHQMLYQSQNLSKIDLEDYFRQLVGLLVRSYHVRPNRISVNLELESVVVSIEDAIPCGLIVNELLSNAFKHAFPGDRQGEIMIGLGRAEAGDISITVSDNGIGVPAGFDFRNSGRYGLVSVFSIVEYQLEGQIEFEANGGVTCRIRFADDDTAQNDA